MDVVLIEVFFDTNNLLGVDSEEDLDVEDAVNYHDLVPEILSEENQLRHAAVREILEMKIVRVSPVLRPNSLKALIHQICQRPLSHLTGHPSLERTPLSEPQSQRCPCLPTTTELGERGGGVPRRGDEAWCGAGKRMCYI